MNIIHNYILIKTKYRLLIAPKKIIKLDKIKLKSNFKKKYTIYIDNNTHYLLQMRFDYSCNASV